LTKELEPKELVIYSKQSNCLQECAKLFKRSFAWQNQTFLMLDVYVTSSTSYTKYHTLVDPNTWLHHITFVKKMKSEHLYTAKTESKPLMKVVFDEKKARKNFV